MFNSPNNNLIKLGGNPCELRATRGLSLVLSLTEATINTRSPEPKFEPPTLLFSRAHMHTFVKLLFP